ncbi:hypothetical protein, partial [Pseudoalteromonas tetraodonis]|uniref:hypothetical protein n=1 Tax=Pseudoalteromonas tetraodonis TaxID=43659 RepID=UPI003000FCA5
DGRKTVTRRPLKVEPRIDNCGNFIVGDRNYGQDINGNPQTKAFTDFHAPCRAGDLIWVRETFCLGRLDEVDAEHPADRTLFIDQGCGNEYCIQKEWAVYKGVEELDEVKWKPSIHMPRKSSRLTLRVTDVRCERVQKMNKVDAVNEGFDLSNVLGFPRVWFKDVWNSIYSNWDQNPWVWVIEFEVIKKNVDGVAK